MFKLLVLSCLLGAACASSFFYSAPLLAPYNYRGPLSLAPGQPANILAADGRPLDTLDVNLDRAAHYTAKAFDGGVHLLKKRSAALAYAAPVLPAAPLLSAAPLLHAPLTYAARFPAYGPTFPLTYTAPIAHAIY